MPKKKKSKKKKKSVKKKSKSKKRKSIKKKLSKNKDNQELIIKTKPTWIKSSLVNKSQYVKKYKESIKNNNEFWKKEGRELLG